MLGYRSRCFHFLESVQVYLGTVAPIVTGAGATHQGALRALCDLSCGGDTSLNCSHSPKSGRNEVDTFSLSGDAFLDVRLLAALQYAEFHPDLELASLNRSANHLKAAKLEWDEAVAHRKIARRCALAH